MPCTPTTEALRDPDPDGLRYLAARLAVLLGYPVNAVGGLIFLSAPEPMGLTRLMPREAWEVLRRIEQMPPTPSRNGQSTSY